MNDITCLRVTRITRDKLAKRGSKDQTKREYKFINKKWKRITPDPKITQRNLSALITREKQFYKKRIEKIEKRTRLEILYFPR